MSRTQSWIDRLENNQPIDWQRENTLLALDMLRQGERFAEELIERNNEADDHFRDRQPRRDAAR